MVGRRVAYRYDLAAAAEWSANADPTALLAVLAAAGGEAVKPVVIPQTKPVGAEGAAKVSGTDGDSGVAPSAAPVDIEGKIKARNAAKNGGKAGKKKGSEKPNVGKMVAIAILAAIVLLPILVLVGEFVK
jgi:hypothetical protein